MTSKKNRKDKRKNGLRIDDKLWFGKYKGKSIKQICSIDLQYVNWLDRETSHKLNNDAKKFVVDKNTSASSLEDYDNQPNMLDYSKNIDQWIDYSPSACADYLDNNNINIPIDQYRRLMNAVEKEEKGEF